MPNFGAANDMNPKFNCKHFQRETYTDIYTHAETRNNNNLDLFATVLLPDKEMEQFCGKPFGGDVILLYWRRIVREVGGWKDDCRE